MLNHNAIASFICVFDLLNTAWWLKKTLLKDKYDFLTLKMLPMALALIKTMENCL